jgi:hypothetical protein
MSGDFGDQNLRLFYNEYRADSRRPHDICHFYTGAQP